MFGVSGSGLRVSGFERGGMDGRVDRVEGKDSRTGDGTVVDGRDFDDGN